MSVVVQKDIVGAVRCDSGAEEGIFSFGSLRAFGRR